MFSKTKISVAVVVVALGALMFAPSAFAQKSPQTGTNITVSKPGGGGMHTTIQSAVNAAEPGDIIEILDEGVYEEQVTFFGSNDMYWENSPWPSTVKGGKRRITLRYVPTPGSRARPTIRYRDTRNRSPETRGEAAEPGYVIGTSANFETCAAVRILATSDITIEGIVIDGISSMPFHNANVWGNGVHHSHGNAAVSISTSGNIQIRDCELRNAFFGIYVKDRNAEGVFANPNTNDNDAIMPLFNFGGSGGHLFEYNKIGENETGIFFESSWDLASTVRYNLIYRNHNRSTAIPGFSGSGRPSDLQAAGIMFKDNYLSPVAIYNNTFFENGADLLGGWQVGYQHLIFNNIFSKPYSYREQDKPPQAMSIDAKFPERMKHNVFAADFGLSIISEPRYCPPYNVYATSATFVRFGRGGNVTNVRFEYQTVETCTEFPSTENIAMIKPGASIYGGAFPASANNRWLETAGFVSGTASLPSMFESTDPTHPDFLVPKWDMPEVAAFIRHGGWEASGIINEFMTTGRDGEVADLGAIPFRGKRPCDGVEQLSRVRIRPLSPVMVTGANAQMTRFTADFYVYDDIGGNVGSLEIKYFRVVFPLPDNRDSWGSDGVALTSSMISHQNLNLQIVPGRNRLSFYGNPLSAGEQFGFIELGIGGKAGIGRPVTTDVGFLPLRKMDTHLKIEAFNADGVPVSIGSFDLTTSNFDDAVVPVTVDEPVTLRVTAMNTAVDPAVPFVGPTGTPPMRARYRLGNPRANMYLAGSGRPLTDDDNLITGGSYTKEYTVYFTESGTHEIKAAAMYRARDSVSFFGSAYITVKTKPLEDAGLRVVFTSPPSGSTATMRGFYPVDVEVQDIHGNPVDIPVTVSMVSSDPSIGTVSPRYADTRNGRVQFVAQTTPGAADGASVRLTAEVNVGNQIVSDEVTLTVERLADESGPPRVVSGGYQHNDGFIYATRLEFDRPVTSDMFQGMTFAFGLTPERMPYPQCITGEQGNEFAILVNMSCGLNGTTPPVSMGDDSRIILNFNSTMGWAPHTVSMLHGEVVSVKGSARDVSQQAVNVEDAAVIVPANRLSAEFTAGPNPAGRSSGVVHFYYAGITSGSLTIFDAAGNVVTRIPVNNSGNNAGTDNPNRRLIATWDLKDRRGRPVAEGTYLARGAVRAANGRRERVSMIIGVR